MKENNIALLVIYNHRYDQNIPRIERLYAGRFSHIYHLMPFYDGSQKNVIPVYDSSFYFQNYIAQAYHHIKNNGYTHFFVVADDMIINPKINETNLLKKVGLDSKDCYISRLTIFQERRDLWYWMPMALKYRIKQTGVEVEKILPTKEEAIKQFELHHIPTSRIPLKRVLTKNWNDFKQIVLKQLPFSLTLDYPLVGGYSDILIVPADIMPKFCQYCGAFAATKLFVEVAIPTALVLSSPYAIKTDADLGIKRGDWPSAYINKMLKSCDFKLDKLLDNFPQGYLYLHPVKLSKWK